MAKGSNPLLCFDQLLAASPLPRTEARSLLVAASGQTREWLIAHGNETAPAAIEAAYKQLEKSRVNGRPLAYLTGKRAFFGRLFSVSPAVLIPRMETEMLVSLAIEKAPRGGRLLELGTGSGAIAVSIAAERPDLQVTATDLSEAALAVARANAHEHGTRISFRQGSWWEAVSSTKPFAMVISNPPYLAQDDEHLALGDLRFEPGMALASGPDGFDALKSIIASADQYLLPGGSLCVEHGWQQADAVQAAMTDARLETVESLRDDQGHWRVTTARTPVHKTVV
ncbi:MAG: peptide chain release factor N(5)-glutamine methyltransferase [Burkholderiaceae bacterium]